LLKIKVLEKGENKLVLDIDGINPAFANALRRVSMTEVPVMAVKYVDFVENDSVMFDEMLAQRIGLMPLKFKPGEFNFPEECECKGKGCPNCQVTLVLERVGPGTVYSGDFVSTHEDVVPLYDNIPLVKLGEDQKLKLEAVATLGRGLDHAKYRAAIVSYKYYPEITVDGRKLKDGEAKKIVKSCPPGVFEYDGKKPVVKNPEKCILCMECVEASEAVKVEPKDTRFIFQIESISALDPKYILNEALEILKRRAKELEDKL